MILIVPWSAEGHVIISATKNAGTAMRINVGVSVNRNAGLVIMKIGIIWIRATLVKAHAKNVTSVYIANASHSQFVMNAMPAMRKPTNVLISAILVTNAKNRALEDVKNNADNVITARQLIIKESV